MIMTEKKKPVKKTELLYNGIIKQNPFFVGFYRSSDRDLF